MGGTLKRYSSNLWLLTNAFKAVMVMVVVVASPEVDSEVDNPQVSQNLSRSPSNKANSETVSEVNFPFLYFVFYRTFNCFPFRWWLWTALEQDASLFNDLLFAEGVL
ncbi:hypothetical protein Y032_0219g2448 [Ancylostoma ceylanicum]|uniref:Uncharacterized protein n=1 Tax=Ancylostoma ceylanicum TaxID=53326 RepID=A0A016SJC1_9BILA|nr:hypothetical protein Y032_0219g2448 [Ancylostoma ceylanicum]